MRRLPITRAGLLAAAAMALTLAACDRTNGAGNGSAAANESTSANSALPALPAAVPLQQGSATPIAPAPSVTALPRAQPVPVAQLTQPSDAYAYLDRAAGVASAIGDAPPDYAYDDGDVAPWAWQTSAGDVQYAEPVQGGYRYYYYEPGAASPYLVRDPSYSYAYSGGRLAAVYDARGALLPPDGYRERTDYASRYYARAAYLRRLAGQREHRGVVAADWAARRSEIAAARSQWSADRARQSEWQAYHQAHDVQERDHWSGERQQRQAQADRFDRWQRGGLNNPPPAPLPRPDDSRRQQQVARQQDQQDRVRRQMDEQHDRDRQLTQQREQRAQDQSAQDRRQNLQRDADQRLAAQRATAHRQQVQDDRVLHQRQQVEQAEADRTQRVRVDADRASARAAEREQRTRMQSDARQHQADVRAQASEVHARAAAQRAEAAVRSHASPPHAVPRPPALHSDVPRGGGRLQHHD
jgi:hypothetical protein